MTRTAVVHDFFAAEGGGERAAIEFTRLFPTADVYTTFFDVARYGNRIDPARVRTWPLQRLLGPSSRFRSFLPLYPLWFSALDLRAYDLVVTSSIAFTNAVRTRPDALHVSYIHTPMRYAWDLDRYLAGSSYSFATKVASRTIRPVLQRWDRWAAQKPDLITTNSETVRGRIRRYWGRAATVIYGPVDVDEIPLSTRDDGYLFVAARLFAYRRLDLAVRAATILGRELVVVGDGPEEAHLRAMAGPTVRFLPRQDRSTLLNLFARCHAYLVPGVEDMGLAPIEAMAAGKPVIAFRMGGATETVLDGTTGTFFDQPSPEALAAGILRLDGMSLDPVAIRSQARRFDTASFRARFAAAIEPLGLSVESET